MHAVCTELSSRPQIGQASLRDKAIALRFMPTSAGDPSLLHLVESAALTREAVTSRRREFAAGRACAAAAMQDLGLAPTPIAMANDRSPVWPDEVVGSISHSRTLAGAAVALRASGILSIGLDIEELEPLAEDLVEEICTESERRSLATLEAANPKVEENRALLAKAIFSAKEAVYKCQYPLTHETFGFDRIEIELEMPQRRFLARFAGAAGPFKGGDQLCGDIWFSASHIIALSSLRSTP